MTPAHELGVALRITLLFAVLTGLAYPLVMTGVASGLFAAARGLVPAALRRLVEAHVEGRALGLFGEPHVNVLDLDMALGTLTAASR